MRRKSAQLDSLGACFERAQDARGQCLGQVQANGGAIPELLQRKVPSEPEWEGKLSTFLHLKDTSLEILEQKRIHEGVTMQWTYIGTSVIVQEA